MKSNNYGLYDWCIYKRLEKYETHIYYTSVKNCLLNLLGNFEIADIITPHITQLTKNPKKLWKTLKQLGLPEKRSPSTNICLKAENGLTFDLYTISEMFKKLFSNLPNDVVQKRPAAANKFTSLVINL